MDAKKPGTEPPAGDDVIEQDSHLLFRSMDIEPSDAEMLDWLQNRSVAEGYWGFVVGTDGEVVISMSDQYGVYAIDIREAIRAAMKAEPLPEQEAADGKELGS